jgi:phosphoglycerate dehydrogenase-like enzyme
MQRLAEQQAAKVWARTPFREISRTKWVIFGYGPIGREVATRAKAFGADISVIRRKPSADAIVDRAGTMADMAAMLADADVVVLACPLNGETRGFANARFFAALKPGAVLVNIARGGLIDDGALIEALDTGRVSFAILDVFAQEPLPTSDPYWSHPRVRLTPHTSFSGSGVNRRWEDLFIDNIGRFVAGEPLANEVAPADIA